MSLQFRFGDVLSDIQHCMDANGRFIENSHVLDSWRLQLDRFRHRNDGETTRWEIPRGDQSLRTRVSKGAYEPDSKGGHEVQARISSIWEIRKRSKAVFELSGKASTEVQITDIDDIRKLNTWTFDVADAMAPGFHFHAQMKWNLAVPVPRFPIPFSMPHDSVEFVLGELFQDEWAQHRSKQRWPVPAQTKRLRQMSAWLQGALADTQNSWAALKQAKPPVDLFLQ